MIGKGVANENLDAVFCLLLPAHTLRAGMVTLSQDEDFYRMSNGVLHVTIEKNSGRISSAAMGGQELLGSGAGYWSM